MSKYVHLNQPQPFSFQPNEWPTWKANYERYSIASEVNKKDDDQQINTLMYVMGPRANVIEKKFRFEANEDKKKYATILSKFDAYFKPPKNIIRERCIFNKRVQKKGETEEQFIEALHKLSETCDFGTMKDEMIRDRIVAGITDSKLKRKLKSAAKLTLRKAIEIVGAYEGRQNQQKLQRRNSQSSTQKLKLLPANH